jgi:V/A-type H+-transporting ATPase subunit I
MIVPMKKIHLIVRKQGMHDALLKLRDLSCVHVEPLEAAAARHLGLLREDVVLLKRAVDALRAIRQKGPQESFSDWRIKAEEIARELTEIEQLTEDMTKRELLIAQWEPWGDFNPEDVERLRFKGIHLQLFKAPAGKPVDVREGAVCQIIFTADKFYHCVAVSKEPLDFPFEIVKWPECGLDSLKALQQKGKALIEKAEQGIGGNVKYLDFLEDALLKAQDKLTFEEAASGMKQDEQLSLLKGFLPQDRCEQLTRYAKQEHWGVLIEDPSDEDRVPTLLRNPKWVEMIKPVFKLIDIIPGYKEVDVSFIFLVFFSIFFGILVGDAAYGLIYMALTMTAHIKLGKKLKEKSVFYLMYLLCLCAVIWGVLTGTYFGQKWLPAPVGPLVPWLNDMNNIQLFCFLVAGIHLTIAHLWNVILKFPRWNFLTDIGWMAVVWAMFFAARFFVLGHPFPSFGMPLMLTGIFLVVFFTKPNKNPLKAVGPGLGNLAMNFINSFTDVVSYIRLFAVGLATVAVADAFNDMAIAVGFNHILTALGASFILVVGHLLNMILAGLAVLVHGIRLNVLEFSGHLGLEWSGVAYHPFKKMEK